VNLVAKVKLILDEYDDYTIDIPRAIAKALNWQYGDDLILEQPNDTSDYLIIHKVDRKEPL